MAERSKRAGRNRSARRMHGKSAAQNAGAEQQKGSTEKKREGAGTSRRERRENKAASVSGQEKKQAEEDKIRDFNGKKAAERRKKAERASKKAAAEGKAAEKANASENRRKRRGTAIDPKGKRKLTPEYFLKKSVDTKIVGVYVVVLLFFVFLAHQVWNIMQDNEQTYKRQVLSQLGYGSTTIPYKRGTITDRNGTVLAFSERVYNVILDTALLTDADRELTINALVSCFDLNAEDIRGFIRDNPDSRYHILKKNVSYEERETYEEYVAAYNADISEQNRGVEAELRLPQINLNTVWFEDQFQRTYPGGSLACDVIGFTTGDGRGQYGLEEYYDDVLSGSNGRTYGYLSDANAMEKTVVPAVNGHTVVSTIDSYLQRICEEKILEYNLEHEGEYREGELGSENTGVIIMDVHTGEVLAMASYPYFDLTDPKDLSMYSEQEVGYLIEREGSEEEASASLWKNFCISQSYEPGSVCKTFTVAAALDAGVIHDGDSYYCGGFLTFGEGTHATTIRCHQRFGDGDITLKQAVEKSCNVALMLIGQKLGKSRFLEYQQDFNFGLKTNIDLAGEMRTSSLVFNENTMGVTELMTSTFGQGFNVTMIQTISAFCSLVNGGYYYQPHMVRQILDDNGAVVENIEPTVLRQVISESVSQHMIDYCIGVVDEGTGTRARPAGYRIGGKTGTAEHSGQGKTDYTVSFMGFAPADDPQIAIYVVIDRPNTATQENGTRYACLLCRDILTEALPYLHIFPTEELTPAEEEEIRQLQENGIQPENVLQEEGAEGEEGTGEEEETGETEENGDVEGETGQTNLEIVIDPVTGYAIDPFNGEYLDPVTGVPINQDSGIFQDATGATIEIEVINDGEE